MNQTIIDAVDVDLIQSELTPERFLRKSNKGGTEIYVFDPHEAPALMREVGRLREIAFRLAGGGTGKECDIDEFDMMHPACQQLIVWDPKNKLILGGYRYILGENIVVEDGKPRIATSHMFNFSQEFLEKYLPSTMELGRSFVIPDFQASRVGARALYTLDNLWDGLGALTVVHPQIKHLFGKVTMYPNYKPDCRNMILYFLHKYFPDPEKLVTPIKALDTGINEEAMAKLFVGGNFKEDYRILNNEVRARGQNIPPLVNAYMMLSPTMKMFGTAINDEFGDVEESGIFFAIDDIFEEKKKRHIATFSL
ncbi:MAG: GNAT family N-acetyltransferase [Bacteroidales bacterium]|nr:GNAT family N-acetyltransferase [Bacteroidales bacterium]